MPRILPPVAATGAQPVHVTGVGSEGGSENALQGGGHRRRRGGRRHAVPLGPQRLGGGDRPAGKRGAHLRLHLACRRAAAAVQHELQRRPAAQAFPGTVPGAGSGNRAGCGVQAGGQHPLGDASGADGRISPIRRHRPHHRRRNRVPCALANQGALASLQHRGASRSAAPSPGRLHSAGGPHPGAGGRGSRPRRPDLSQHPA